MKLDVFFTNKTNGAIEFDREKRVYSAKLSDFSLNHMPNAINLHHEVLDFTMVFDSPKPLEYNNKTYAWQYFNDDPRAISFVMYV